MGGSNEGGMARSSPGSIDVLRGCDGESGGGRVAWGQARAMTRRRSEAFDVLAISCLHSGPHS